MSKTFWSHNFLNYCIRFQFVELSKNKCANTIATEEYFKRFGLVWFMMTTIKTRDMGYRGGLERYPPWESFYVYPNIIHQMEIHDPPRKLRRIRLEGAIGFVPAISVNQL